ncbi:MAG: universal stress protein [Nitrospirota bacterium]
MNNHRCIISGIDLGPDTEKILAYAAYFASKTESKLKLLYVIDYLLTPPSYLKAYIEEEKKREESELSRWKTLLAKKGINAECRIVLGRLHESFTRVIREISTSLLVIGYKSHPLRPSSSERLIKTLKMPMLVVRGKTTENVRIGSAVIKKILCPVDFSDNSIKAVLIAKEYASHFGAILQLAHIIPSYLIKEKWVIWQRLGENDRRKFDETMQSEAESNLSSVCKETGVERGGEIYHGNPAEIISSIADNNNYDLVIMGARGISYLQGILIGSTTESVLKSSPCPVLVIH